MERDAERWRGRERRGKIPPPPSPHAFALSDKKENKQHTQNYTKIEHGVAQSIKSHKVQGHTKTEHGVIQSTQTAWSHTKHRTCKERAWSDKEHTYSMV